MYFSVPNDTESGFLFAGVIIGIFIVMFILNILKNQDVNLNWFEAATNGSTSGISITTLVGVISAVGLLGTMRYKSTQINKIK